MIPKTSARVRKNTAEAVNAAIRRQTEENISYYASAGPAAVERRLQELDSEWDIERVLEANAAGFSLAAVILGVVEDRKWLLLPGVIAAFLLQHAVQGWCPLVPLLRRLGFRTESEINRERYALKALRGGLPRSRASRGAAGAEPCHSSPGRHRPLAALRYHSGRQLETIRSSAAQCDEPKEYRMSQTAYPVSRKRWLRERPGGAADKSNPFNPALATEAIRLHRRRSLSGSSLELQHQTLLALWARLRDNVAQTADAVLAGSTEATSASPDTADLASETVEQDLALNLLGSAAGTLDQIEAALQRIEDGSYGRCAKLRDEDSSGPAGGHSLRQLLRRVCREPGAGRLRQMRAIFCGGVRCSDGH